MQWTEVSLQTTHEQADTIAAILYSAGAQGVAMEDPLLINQLRASGTWELCDIPEQQNTEVVTVTAYYPDDENLSERLEFSSREVKAVVERIGQKCVFRNPLFRTLCEQDWANEWKQYFHVTHIGKHLVIKPSWEKYDAKADDLVIEIDPGMAFGTGTHETTSLCLETLDSMVKGGERVLDIGTGRGILAIAALKLGAAVAEGVDIAPVAVRTAGENAALNGVADKLTVLVGDLSDKASGKYDIITANIVANAIMSLAPAVPGLMADDAVFIASGVIDSRKDEVIAALEAAGLAVLEVKEKRGWECIVCKKA